MKSVAQIDRRNSLGASIPKFNGKADPALERDTGIVEVFEREIFDAERDGRGGPPIPHALGERNRLVALGDRASMITEVPEDDRGRVMDAYDSRGGVKGFGNTERFIQHLERWEILSSG